MSEAIPLWDGVADPEAGVVRRGARTVRLSRLEGRLLQYLAEHAGDVVPDQTLLREVWGYRDGVRSRTVFTTVNRLRSKIELDPSHPSHLVTVRGGGYRFDPAHDGPIGRVEEGKALRDALARHRRVTVHGPAGIGKTALVRWIVPDAIWIPLAGVRTRAALEDAVARALVVTHTGPGPVEEALRAREGAVVVLDGAEGLDPASGDAVDRWAEAPGPTFVLTSRHAPVGGSEVPVGPLSDEAARRLWARVASGDPWADGHERLLAWLGGVPLALELAGARLGTLTAAELAVRSAQQLHVLGDGERSWGAVIAASFELATPAEQRALRWWSVFRGGWTVDAAEAVLGDAPDTIALLAELTRKGLVTRDGASGRFSMAEPIRLVAAARASADELDAAGRRHALHFAQRVRARGPSRDDAWRRWASAEESNLDAARVRTSDAAILFHLAEGLDATLERRGFGARSPLWRQVLEAPGFDGLAPDQIGLAYASASLGACVRGEPDAGALARRAISVAPGLALGWTAALHVEEVRGSLAAATEAAARELATATAAGDLVGRARALVNSSRLEAAAGRAERAVELARDAAVEARLAGARRIEGAARGHLSVALRLAGRVAESAEVLQASIADAEAAGAPEAAPYNHLGIALATLGDPEAADDAFRISERLGRLRGDLGIVGSSLALRAMHRPPGEAMLLLREARAVYRRAGVRIGAASATTGLGAMAILLDRPEEALQHLDDAVDELRDCGQVRLLGVAVAWRAVARAASGDPEGAAASLRSARDEPLFTTWEAHDLREVARGLVAAEGWRRTGRPEDRLEALAARTAGREAGPDGTTAEGRGRHAQLALRLLDQWLARAGGDAGGPLRES